jgi:hypothetical protein
MPGSLKALNGWIFLSFKACWLPGLIASQPPGPLASVLSSFQAFRLPSLTAFNYELSAVTYELLFFNLELFKKGFVFGCVHPWPIFCSTLSEVSACALPQSVLLLNCLNCLTFCNIMRSMISCHYGKRLK